MTKALVLLPAIIFLLACLSVIGTDRTIAPLDILTITPELYQPGNASKIHNGYVIDTVEVFVPWKYYISQFHPEKCTTDVGSPLSSTKVLGIKLPQGECFPFMAARAYTARDLFFPLSRVFNFFSAYDLSYLIFLAALYFSFLYFLCAFLPGASWSTRVLISAAATTSFPVARDLQADGLSHTIPFLLTSLGMLRRSLNRGLLFVLGSVLFLFLACIKSSLQGLGFAPLFWALFILVWDGSNLKSVPHKAALLTGLVGAGVLALLYHWPAVLLFTGSSGHYLTHSETPFIITEFKRVAALGFSFVNFLTGDLFMSFSTVDPSKILGNLGARDYPSYDYASYFIQPLVSIYFLIYFVHQLLNKKLDKHMSKLGLVFLIDLVFTLLPTYRIFYFRFHQWWMLVNLSLILGVLIEEGTHLQWSLRDFLAAGAFLIFGMGSLFTATELGHDWILGHLLGHGYLGFEPGFWENHLNALTARLSFRDTYSLMFVLSIGAGCLLFKTRWKKSLVVLVTITGLALNIYFVNFPQRQRIFLDYLSVLERNNGEKDLGKGMPQPSNLNLLINKPAYNLYESLVQDRARASEK